MDEFFIKIYAHKERGENDENATRMGGVFSKGTGTKKTGETQSQSQILQP